MEIQKFTNNATTSADMLRKYQDMIVENQGDEDLEEANDDNEDQVDEAQEEVDEDQVDEAKDEDEKEEVKEEIPSTNMLRRYQDMIKEAEKEDEEVDESKDEEVDESKDEEVDESKEEDEVDEGLVFTTKHPKGGSTKISDKGMERTTTGSGQAKTTLKGKSKTPGKGPRSKRDWIHDRHPENKESRDADRIRNRG